METASHHEDVDGAQLLAGLRQGKAGAYETLMRRYNRRLFRAARGVLSDDAEAQDAVQEAYLRAFVAMQTFRGESSLGTWLTRIVINESLSRQRKLGRCLLWGDAHFEEDEPMPAPNEPSAAPDTTSPEQALLRRQLRERLQQAVDLLPPIYRSVFVLRAMEGLSVRETTECLCVSNDLVKTRYLRARLMLRESLDGSIDQEAAQLYDFRGRRCDELVAAVLARLRSAGLIRDQ